MRKVKTPEGMRYRGVRVALDPTPRQTGLLSMNAGAARYAYNLALDHITRQLDGLEPVAGKGKADWTMRALRDWHNRVKNETTPWWSEVSKEAFTSGFQQVETAFRNYFDSRDGSREGRRMGWPKYRTKHGSKPSYTYTTGSMGLLEGDPKAIRLPRIGRVHVFEDVTRRVGQGVVKSITVSFEHGRWWASLLVLDARPAPSRTLNGGVGVDLNVHETVLSDGTRIPNPLPSTRGAEKIGKARRRMSRRTRGSARWVRARDRVMRLDHRAACRRRDFLDKLTTMLARSYALIGIEDLNVSGMLAKPRPIPDPDRPGRYLRNGRASKRTLARLIADCGFRTFRVMLGYKCALTGARLHVSDRFYASSKTCSQCGAVKAKLSLGERVFRCDVCGMVMDRDWNAAVNLLTDALWDDGRASGVPGGHTRVEGRSDGSCIRTLRNPRPAVGKETRTVQGDRKTRSRMKDSNGTSCLRECSGSAVR